jgi:hypothetical protein
MLGVLHTLYFYSQSTHHPMATERANELFDELNLIDAAVQLDKPIEVERSLVWFNLHIVLVQPHVAARLLRRLAVFEKPLARLDP